MRYSRKRGISPYVVLSVQSLLSVYIHRQERTPRAKGNIVWKTLNFKRGEKKKNRTLKSSPRNAHVSRHSKLISHCGAQAICMHTLV